MTPAAVVAAALAASAVLSIFAYLLSRGQSQAGEMARRLNQYGGDTVAVATPPRVKTGNAIRDLLDGLTSGLNPLLSRTSHTGKLADDLQKADLKLKSSEWLLAVVGLGVLVGLLVAFRYGQPLAFIPCPIVIYFLSGFFPVSYTHLIAIATAVGASALSAGALTASDSWVSGLFAGNTLVTSPVTQDDQVEGAVAGSAGVAQATPLRFLSEMVAGDVYKRQPPPPPPPDKELAAPDAPPPPLPAAEASEPTQKRCV